MHENWSELVNTLRPPLKELRGGAPDVMKCIFRSRAGRADAQGVGHQNQGTDRSCDLGRNPV